MAGAIGKRRMLLLFPVLAGLFLMHGLTGGGAGTASCHGMTPPAMAMASSTMTMTSDQAAHPHPQHPHSYRHAPAPAPADARAMTVTLAPSHPMSRHAQAGETCVPLRPEGLAGLFLVLLLAVATVCWLRVPHSVRLIRPHWPHGPPRPGAQLLTILSISRT